jgi:hypothetical protein
VLLRWLLPPVLLLSAWQPAPPVHPADVDMQPASFAPISATRYMGGESAELDAELRQPPPPPRDRLRAGDGSLDVSVGIYADCSGMTEVTHDGAAIDTCLGGRLFFIGHNPGPFTPLRDLGVGSLITYYDGLGLAHTWRIVQTRTWSRWAGSPPLASQDVVAQFQTCITLDGNWDEILDAAPA